MAKRQADNYLTHDNWDQNEQPEERGNITTADKSVIEQRTFKVAKRRCNESKENTSTPNPFSGFNFHSQPLSNTTKQFPIADVETKNHSNISLMNNKTNVTIYNGNSDQSNHVYSKIHAESNDSSASANSVANGFLPVFSSTIFNSKSSNSINCTATNSESSSSLKNYDSMFSNSKDPKEDPKHITGNSFLIPNKYETSYEKEMRKLNDSVYKWITQHLKKEPHCILTPVFDDYIKYVQKIENSFDITNLETETSSKLMAPSKPNFNLSNMESINKNSSPKKISNNTSFSFSSESKIKDVESVGFKPQTQWSSSNNPNFFSFQKSEDNPNTQAKESVKVDSNGSKPFLFGSDIGAQSNILGTGFQFNSKPMFSFAPNTEAKKDNDEDDGGEDGEDSEEKKKMQIPQSITHETDAFYHIRCKLYYMKDKAYKEKGVGILYLKKLENHKTQLIIRADNVNGNVMLNILLTNAMPITQQRNSISLVCTANPPMEADASTDAAATLLIKVKNVENAEELLSNLNKAKQV